jgi:hypothetical protein
MVIALSLSPIGGNSDCPCTGVIAKQKTSEMNLGEKAETNFVVLSIIIPIELQIIADREACLHRLTCNKPVGQNPLRSSHYLTQ